VVRQVTRGRERDESDEIGAMIGRMLNALVRRADEGALTALVEVEALAPAATNAALALAREVHSLGDLAGFLGVTRSAVAQRAARPMPKGICHPTCVGVKRCRA
jgi:hypothetical protein